MHDPAQRADGGRTVRVGVECLCRIIVLLWLDRYSLRDRSDADALVRADKAHSQWQVSLPDTAWPILDVGLRDTH